MICIITLLSLCALFRVGNAWCIDVFGPPQVGGATCSVDPTDPADFEIIFVAEPEASSYCDGGEDTAFNSQFVLIYEGTDEQTTSTTITTEITAAAPSFTILVGVPLTSIEPGSVVTWRINAADPGQSNFDTANANVESYTQTQIPSIFYTSTTTDITSTLSTESVVTSTFTETDSVTLPASSKTIPCTTGITTFTAKPVTRTTTSIITQAPKTVNEIEVLIITTRLACIPAQPGKGVKNRSPKPRLLAGRDDVVTYETPNCGAVTPTTLTTSTATSLVFTTTVDFSTTFTVATTTLTYPAPPPSTICSDVEASITTTPTVTHTRYSTASRKTVTNIKTYILVETIIDKHAHRCKPTGVPPPLPTGHNGGHIGGHG